MTPNRYAHVEAECPFISFEDLLERLEDLVVDVSERVMASEYAALVKELNPNFQVPKKPFRRMDYAEAIEYLKANEITKDDGSFYEFGEVYLVPISNAGQKLMIGLNDYFRTSPKPPSGK